jgi:hypothetical protein
MNGMTGMTGISGMTGITGITGMTGINSIKGINGMTGITGMIDMTGMIDLNEIFHAEEDFTNLFENGSTTEDDIMEYKKYFLKNLTKLKNYKDIVLLFTELNDIKYQNLVFAIFMVHYILTLKNDDNLKVELNKRIFDGKSDNIKSFATDFSPIVNWTYYDLEQIKLIVGIDKSSMELMKKTYDKYFKIKELLDSNEISKLSEYSNSIDEFIRIQPVENLQKYLTNLDGIYTGLYSEKMESTAFGLKKRVTDLIVGELDNFFRGNPLDETQFDYISRYVALDDVFFPFIASYTETEFIDLEKKVQGTSMQKLFNDQVSKAREKYKKNHELFLGKVDSKIKDLQSKLSIDDYGITKLLLTNVNKLIKELQIAYTRFLQIANIYNAKGKDDFKILLKERVTLVQTLLKKIVEKEAFLKDKEFNNRQRKEHQFTLGIELLINVQGIEKLKYTPNMTIPSGGGDAVYFTPRRAMHKNIIESIPSDKPPEYKYIQLTKLQDFNYLLNRISSSYFLEADEPFDEYSKVYKKKNDDLTNANIGIVLDTLFYTGSPFYIGSDRYTTFSYDWENGVEKITKNDKKETYGDEDDITELVGPTSIQWQNIFGRGLTGAINPPNATGATGATSAINTPNATILSKPNHNSDFTQEIGEVGTMIKEEHKSDEVLDHEVVLDTNEQTEVGTMIKEEHKSDELDHIIASDTNEQNEVGTMIKEEHKSDELDHVIRSDTSEQNEVGTMLKGDKADELDHVITSDTNEPNEVGTVLKGDKADELGREVASDTNEPNEVGTMLKEGDKSEELGRKIASDTNEPNEVGTILKEGDKADELGRKIASDTNEPNEVGTIGSVSDIPTPTTTTTPTTTPTTTTTPPTTTPIDENDIELELDSEETGSTPDVTAAGLPTKPEEVEKVAEETPPIKETPPSKNTDRTKNSTYMDTLTPNPNKKYQDRFLKLLRLEQTKDVNAIHFTSLLDEPMSGGYQTGGANALYIDLDQETIFYSQKKKEFENEIKKQQEDELTLLSKQNEDLNNDDSIQEVKWKYFVIVELQLYPGDHIPLSAYASLACSKKSNDIYNIWQNILTKIKNPNSKEKYKKKMLAYTPVIPNKTVKNKDTEPVSKNNTVKVRETPTPK